MIDKSLSGAVIQRKVDWMDTDAAGHYHHSTVIRWVEAAEAELFESLGLANLFGSIPRVRYEVDYVNRVWFGDIVTIQLCVIMVGKSSIRYAFDVSNNDMTIAKGFLVVVNTEKKSGNSEVWEDRIRLLLSGSD